LEDYPELQTEAAEEITRLREELRERDAEIDQFSGILADYKDAAASEAERANELNAENRTLCEENARLREERDKAVEEMWKASDQAQAFRKMAEERKA
jgi:uncharacterized coiled-coil DUF342 family protein